MTDSTKRWRTLTSRPVYENPWLGVREDTTQSPGGRNALFGLVHYRNIAVGILPVDADGGVHLVGQWRHGAETFSWEMPEGGAARDGDLLADAKRELREETGLDAAHWRPILRMHMSNSVTDEEAVIFLATGLTYAGAPEPEPSEEGMEQMKTPFAEALRRATSGEIMDAMTVAALLRTHQMAVQGELEPELCQAILRGPR